MNAHTEGLMEAVSMNRFSTHQFGSEGLLLVSSIATSRLKEVRRRDRLTKRYHSKTVLVREHLQDVYPVAWFWFDIAQEEGSA